MIHPAISQLIPTKGPFYDTVVHQRVLNFELLIPHMLFLQILWFLPMILTLTTPDCWAAPYSRKCCDGLSKPQNKQTLSRPAVGTCFWPSRLRTLPQLRHTITTDGGSHVTFCPPYALQTPMHHPCAPVGCFNVTCLSSTTARLDRAIEMSRAAPIHSLVPCVCSAWSFSQRAICCIKDRITRWRVLDSTFLKNYDLDPCWSE